MKHTLSTLLSCCEQCKPYQDHSSVLDRGKVRGDPDCHQTIAESNRRCPMNHRYRPNCAIDYTCGQWRSSSVQFSSFPDRRAMNMRMRSDNPWNSVPLPWLDNPYRNLSHQHYNRRVSNNRPSNWQRLDDQVDRAVVLPTERETLLFASCAKCPNTPGYPAQVFVP